MAEGFFAKVVTPSVQEQQRHYYGKARTVGGDTSDPLGSREIAFISTRDSFYMATVGETGWPYVQHRGGPEGFLRVLSPREIAFADLGGNRQLISAGNLAANDRVCLFLMDYPRRMRLKILGTVEVLDADAHPGLTDQIAHPEIRGSAERLFRITIASYDWNCPQHITPRFSADELEAVTGPLHQRIRELESQLEDRP